MNLFGGQNSWPGQPPLLVFTVCLMAFGLTMVGLAYIVGQQEVPNPDILMDWNKFFSKVAHFKLCRSHLNAGPHFEGDVEENFNATLNSTSNVIDESKSMSAALSNVVDKVIDKGKEEAFVEISVKVVFNISNRLRIGVHYVKGKIIGKLLGFTGKYATTKFNVSFSFQSLNKLSCISGNCFFPQEVCLTLSLPSEFLQETKIPDKCKARRPHSKPFSFHPIYFSEIANQGDICVELQYTSDSRFVQMLSIQDRSIVNLHLMHTSYFLFVLVMTLVCYSLIKRRFQHPKSSRSFEKLPMDA